MDDVTRRVFDARHQPRGLSDSDRNIMWDLRFEGCEVADGCPHNYHHQDCPESEEQ